jgi:hypothetical protein
MKANALGITSVMFLSIASACGQGALKNNRADASVLGGTIAVGGVSGAGGTTWFGGNAGSGGAAGSGGRAGDGSFATELDYQPGPAT